ncbi:MAG: hypothetical protein LKH74_00935 [Levilactobacillus sp.]|jgi:hypothetical protein|uniref:Uncharacterized protein n=1 Tax=Levilactobacillus suantsaiihabitans TaxID=2487722 RepID=A0A4Z0JB27_9LACO|nr:MULTISPECIES: hypothetical protein [Levilactobacillus]MCH4123388.1 hypothetical protein [Levilactobacillus sp.]MCI1552474.1 hypothetical protein [Levilactobacillus sp.]MCI1599828.1 hypothetical protein [Levilactobacillus sp.]MCI1606615.1 hypothetical protein [Levilactobacillus sp.]TGD19026.1 hypothetical protein EGT51_06410 [Levilactobacillus suantsaiihabitans]
MKKDRWAVIALAILAVCGLSLVLLLMKSPVWAFGFPLAFAVLGAACYGIEEAFTKMTKNNHREA